MTTKEFIFNYTTSHTSYQFFAFSEAHNLDVCFFMLCHQDLCLRNFLREFKSCIFCGLINLTNILIIDELSNLNQVIIVQEIIVRLTY